MDKQALIKALRDTAQSASNAIASNISGPVDLINAGLGYIGLPVSNAPIGGSNWMKAQGLTRDVEMGAPRIVGETLGMAGPSVIAAKAPQIAGALNQGMANLAAPRTLHPETGAIVWHGSPHRFDKFDSSKIGTGEGAQAYGHGLYLAESPSVAKSYADELSSKIDVNGKPLFQANKIVGTTGNPELDDYLVANLGDLTATKRQLLSDIRDVRSGNRQGAKEMQKTLADLRKSQVASTNTGQLYKVDLPDEHIAKMLDWDKPLSQQAPEVKKALESLGYKYDDVASAQYSDDLLNALFNDAPPPSSKIPSNPMGSEIARGKGIFDQPQDKVIAEKLSKAGIPGIRYLDQGSRNTGAGTSNFVVFPGNEEMLTILERNGNPLANALRKLP